MHPASNNPGRVWQLLTLIEWTTDYFQKRDIDSPRITAETLIARSLSLERIDLYTHFDRPMTELELADIKAMIKRRVNREPTAYITGEKEFWSLPMMVTPNVLIPRPETECLVEEALSVLDGRNGANSDVIEAAVLELGCGSGAVSIAMASERPDCRFTASDCSLAALAVARNNARVNGVADRIRFVAGDWVEPFSQQAAGFHLIVSNPPYIVSGEIQGLQPEVSRFEPRVALDGGSDGLDCLRRIIHTAPGILQNDGWLLLEIGWDQADAVARIAEESGRFARVHFRKDYSGFDRVAKLNFRG